ncbi:MAG: glycosyltransferase [Planctomycetota bacterium]
MKVLHLVHNYPPEFAGGTEIYLQALVREQLRLGFEVLLLVGSETRSPHPTLTEETAACPRVVRFRRAENEHYRVDFRPRGLKGFLASLADRFRPHVVHVHHWFNLGNDIVAFLSGRGFPVILTLHDLYAGCPRIFMIRPDGFFCGQLLPVPVDRCVECVAPDYNPPGLRAEIQQRRRLMGRELERAARVIVPSTSHASMLARTRLVSAERLTILGHGLLNVIRPDDRQPKPGVLRLGTWGHLSRVKGIVELLSALRRLHERYPGKVELHLFGRPTPDFGEELTDLCKGLPVHLHGAYKTEEMSRFSREIDLALFPSHAHESYSFVLDEACALRILAIVSDRGALADRGRRFAETVDPTDPGAIAAAVERYLVKPELLEERRALLPEQPFSIAHHAERLSKIYAEVVPR